MSICIFSVFSALMFQVLNKWQLIKNLKDIKHNTKLKYFLDLNNYIHFIFRI